MRITRALPALAAAAALTLAAGAGTALADDTGGGAPEVPDDPLGMVITQDGNHVSAEFGNDSFIGGLGCTAAAVPVTAALDSAGDFLEGKTLDALWGLVTGDGASIVSGGGAPLDDGIYVVIGMCPLSLDGITPEADVIFVPDELAALSAGSADLGLGSTE